MLIPQSVSYATSLAKMNPVTGLVRFRYPRLYYKLITSSCSARVSQFSASIPAIIYAVLGSSHHLNVAPEAALSMMLGQAVNDIKHEFPDPDDESGMQRGLHIATIITLQVRLISVGLHMRAHRVLHRPGYFHSFLVFFDLASLMSC